MVWGALRSRPPAARAGTPGASRISLPPQLEGGVSGCQWPAIEALALRRIERGHSRTVFQHNGVDSFGMEQRGGHGDVIWRPVLHHSHCAGWLAIDPHGQALAGWISH